MEGDEETLLHTGEAATFKAGAEIGHQLINRSDADLVYLEVGTRAATERVHYPGSDLLFERDGEDFKFRHQDGTPY